MCNQSCVRKEGNELVRASSGMKDNKRNTSSHVCINKETLAHMCALTKKH